LFLSCFFSWHDAKRGDVACHCSVVRRRDRVIFDVNT
jgi:hypothetical protein